MQEVTGSSPVSPTTMTSRRAGSASTRPRRSLSDGKLVNEWPLAPTEMALIDGHVMTTDSLGSVEASGRRGFEKIFTTGWYSFLAATDLGLATYDAQAGKIELVNLDGTLERSIGLNAQRVRDGSAMPTVNHIALFKDGSVWIADGGMPALWKFTYSTDG